MRTNLLAGLAFCGLAMLCSAAAANPRMVVVNGQRLTPPQIAQLERLNCARIPDGVYWVNVFTGAWGYHGNPWTMGFVGQACGGAASGGGNSQRQRSLSERGLLYTPGDLNFR
jgi:hypothetical protein